jgi:hypothetical protein
MPLLRVGIVVVAKGRYAGRYLYGVLRVGCAYKSLSYSQSNVVERLSSFMNLASLWQHIGK